MDLNKIDILSEIKEFLEGYNSEIKYLVNVETDPNVNYAECIIHEPGCEPVTKQIRYEPFIYMKDLKLNNLELYEHRPELLPEKMKQYGITMTKLETGNQKRLVEGYCWKITSHKSYKSILNFLDDGRVGPYTKLRDEDGDIVYDDEGKSHSIYRNMFYSVKTNEQFFISNKCRLYKGFEEYKDVHKVTFDIETMGLRYQMKRIFAVGIRDNRGFEVILRAKVLNNDAAEIELIKSVFEVIIKLKPAILSGYNSEMFDIDFILGRAKILKMNLNSFQTTLNKDKVISRKTGVSVKYGNTPDKYTATNMWGVSVIDILHAVKKTAAVNTEIKENKLKYIAKFEKIAKPNRTYIDGSDGKIFRYYEENKIFVVNDKNEYIQVPEKHQIVARKLYILQANKAKMSEGQYKGFKNVYLSEDTDFVDWFRKEALKNNMITFISGKKLVDQYLLDDLWETEKVDELYNQSAFMLAKIVPTTYHRICTMGTAGVWNLLLTAWSYERNLAIPDSDVYDKFSGGLARCYKTGFSRRWVKIDYASLYPMLQLTDDIFPIFDITGVIKKLLLYLTTTRNIYKKIANSDNLNEEEIYILKAIDSDIYTKYTGNTLTDKDRAMCKTKQLPIKILNNSLFGALGANIAFNWSDNVCAARITCTGRLELRHAISWFTQYGCVALLAVTDGINFQIPDFSNIKISQVKGVPDTILDEPISIEEAWQYNGKTGIGALIDKFNAEEMKAPFMSVDNDGEFLSCLNLSRINYATLSLVKDKKTGEMKEKVKLTGNTIKSKIMPEYIEEFIDEGLKLILQGKGVEFIDYYYSYAENIYYKSIPLKKIASKSKIKVSLAQYKKRGLDKNGKEKGKQAHMELLIEKRDAIVNELFEKHKADLSFKKDEEKLSLADKYKLISDYMPPEPELDSIVYHVNTGYRKSDGSSNKIIDRITGLERYASNIITTEELDNNPTMTGDYNVVKYLDSFNKRVKSILVGFDPEIAKLIPCKIVKKKIVDALGVKQTVEELKKASFTSDQLVLKHFDKDDYDQSMFLENDEIDFWNKNGFDPRLTWNGFNVTEEKPIYYEHYEDTLKYLNDKMASVNRPLIKSINDKYAAGDLVLIKTGFEFSLGQYNGTYLKIIKEIKDFPKSETFIRLEKEQLAEKEKIRALSAIPFKPSDKETFAERKANEIGVKRNRYFKAFLTHMGIGHNISIAEFITIPNAVDGLDDYIDEQELLVDNEAAEYVVDEID